MEKYILYFAILLAPLFPMYGLDLSGRVGCEIPQEKTFRSVYGNGLIIDFELEASSSIGDLLTCDTHLSNCSNLLSWSDLFNWDDLPNWNVWMNLSYFEKNGHFTYLKEKTNLVNWSLNIGFKRYFCYAGAFRPYFGFGIGAAHACFREHSIYVKHEIDGWGFAFLAKSGIEYDFTPCVFLDVFADYAFNGITKPHSKCGVSTRSTNTGGLKLGMGLGWRL